MKLLLCKLSPLSTKDVPQADRNLNSGAFTKLGPETCNTVAIH